MRFASLLILATLSACAVPFPAADMPAPEYPVLLLEFSTDANEYNPSVDPMGRTMVFARSEPEFRNGKILISSMNIHNAWSPAARVPFSDDRYTDTDPTFSPDGRTLYFASDRPAAGRDAARRDLDLWRVSYRGGRWGTPEHLGAEVNSPAQELGPTWHDGWLYFGSSRGGAARMLDLYRAPERGGRFGAAEALPDVNTGASEGDPELSADGSLLLFWSDRPGGAGAGDLYASRRTPTGWSAPAPLRVNTTGFDFTPSFTRDGRWLYFASDRTGIPGAALPGHGNLYRARTADALPAPARR